MTKTQINNLLKDFAKSFSNEYNQIAKNVDGSALPYEIESFLVKVNADAMFSKFAFPQSFAKKVDKLFDILDGCDGSEQTRLLKSIKF